MYIISNIIKKDENKLRIYIIMHNYNYNIII
jgi:hypothetical protein